MSKLPNLFLIGAMKAGTTSLSTWLGNSSSIFVPKIKEPNYYSKELHENGILDALPKGMLFDVEELLDSDAEKSIAFAYINSERLYRKLYSPAPEHCAYRLDASTTYLNSPFAAAAIHATNPGAKIMVVTRDPLARAWSEFLMNVSIGVTDMDYKSALEREVSIILGNKIPLTERYISTGLYDINLTRFKSFFAKDQILELRFESFSDDFSNVHKSVSDFLEIDDLPPEITAENVSRTPRFRTLNNILHRSGLKYWLRDRTPEALRDHLQRVFYGGDRVTMPADFSAHYEAARKRILDHINTGQSALSSGALTRNLT